MFPLPVPVVLAECLVVLQGGLWVRMKEAEGVESG